MGKAVSASHPEQHRKLGRVSPCLLRAAPASRRAVLAPCRAASPRRSGRSRASQVWPAPAAARRLRRRRPRTRRRTPTATAGRCQGFRQGFSSSSSRRRTARPCRRSRRSSSSGGPRRGAPRPTTATSCGRCRGGCLGSPAPGQQLLYRAFCTVLGMLEQPSACVAIQGAGWSGSRMLQGMVAGKGREGGREVVWIVICKVFGPKGFWIFRF